MKVFNSQLSWNTLKSGKFLLLNFCFIALITVGVYSCTEHDEIADVGVIKNEQPLTPRSPTTVSDRVYFTDYDDFVDYYGDLEYIIDTYNGDYFDSIVNLNTAVQTLNDVVTATPGYFGPIADPIMRAVVNGYNEFQIDDILVTLIDDDQWLLSDVSNGTLKTSLRGLTKGSRLSMSSIPAGAQWASPNNLEDALAKFWCGCRVEIEIFDCETIRVFGSCSGWFGTSGGGLVTIEIGNTAIVTNAVVANNFQFFVDIAQFHGMEQILSVTGISGCDNADNPAFTFWNFDPEDVALCDDDTRFETFTFTDPSDAERIRIRVHYFNKNFTTKTHNAEMWSESSTNAGITWTSTEANMTVGVDANQRDFHCGLIDSKDDEKHKNSDRHVIVRVNWLASQMYHCDDDLIGEFLKIKNNITIDEEYSLNFQCCDE